MLDFSHIPNAANGAETFVFNALGVNDWQTWVKPRGKSIISILAIGGGAGGGGGFSAAAAAARGGGGGGGCSGLSRMIIPAFSLPDILYVQVGSGGVGGAAASAGAAAGLSRISVKPDSVVQNGILLSGTGASGGGGAGSATAAGTQGAASTAATAPVCGAFSCLGISLNFIAGQIGASGGAQTGAVGNQTTWGSSGFPLSGGAGGGGTTSADFAGGAITGGGWFPTIAGGLAALRGQDGFYSAVPFGACGGSGGGSSNAATGGAGGDGAIGCGGGGGGAGVTGGAGGKGGHGLVIINCW
jgi:hypothetical protein